MKSNITPESDFPPANPIISGTTEDGMPFHELRFPRPLAKTEDHWVVQRNWTKQWHGYHNCTHKETFTSETEALQWLQDVISMHPAEPSSSSNQKSSIVNHQSSISPSSLPQSPIPNPQSPFSFRSYQKEDLARAALHDGAIIGWDPGMGKTMAVFALPFLKRARFALIIAPAGLHEQLMDEGREKFGIQVTPIPDQETAYRLMREGVLPLPGSQDSRGQTPETREDKEAAQAPRDATSSSGLWNLESGLSKNAPAFFITSYNWLGYNGGDEWQPAEPTELLRLRRLMCLRRSVDFQDGALAGKMASLPWKTKSRVEDWTALSIPANSKPEKIRIALRTAALLFHPTLHPGDVDAHWRFKRIFDAAAARLQLSPAAADKLRIEIDADPALRSTGEALFAIEKGIGTERDIGYEKLDIGKDSAPREAPQSPMSNVQCPTHTIKCVFRPTLASLLCGIFDFVVADEAVRLKSGTAYVAQGVLRMQSRCRYALTGTPIKNKLPDLFFLASWVTGHTSAAIARWPYGNTTEDRGAFSRDFGVLEENTTAAEKARANDKRPPPPKTTNQVCNVHRLWRILGPVLIRRRKDDVPECDLVSKTIVPIRVMPGAEQKRVYKFHLDHAPEHDSILASIGAQLQNLRQAALNPSSLKLTHGGRSGRSSNPWTPKFTAILQLATDLLTQGEQLVIFSPFQDFSESLAARFKDAAVPHLLLDGKTTPEKRGSLIKKFKSKQIPILIAGIDSMGEGYSLDNASHLVLPSLSWAFDSNTQAVERVHRLTSKKPVTIYCMVTQGTIDERLSSIWQEKGDASDLALDGRLSTQDRREIDLGQLLRDAVKDFDPKSPSLDEEEVRQNWHSTLLPALTHAGAEYARRVSNTKHETSNVKPETPKPSSPSKLNVPCSMFHVPSPPPPRLSLFDIMKNKHNPTTPPASTSSNQQSIINNPQSEITPPNIIPFPGRLSNLKSQISNPPTGPTMPKVNIAQLLRR